MKTNLKKLSIIPLLLAVAAAPICAQNNAGTDNGATNTASAPSEAPVAPPAPPDLAGLIAPTNQTAATKADNGHRKKHEDDSDSTPVRIDGTGIHIGGKDPVDINVPGMSSSGAAKTSDWIPPGLRSDDTIPPGAVIISLIAITTPFIFLTAVIGGWVYFRYRRNRILHETLRAMIDKGVPIPPELIVPPSQQARRRTNGDLRNGLIMLGLGIGILLFHLRLGWIPIFIGVAFLITWLIEKNQNSKDSQINNSNERSK